MTRIASILVTLAMSACGKTEMAAPPALSESRAPAQGAFQTLEVGGTQRLHLPTTAGVTFLVPSIGEYQIDVRADAGDPWIALYRGDELIEQDDDGGGGPHARIRRELQPGTYRIVVQELRGRAFDAEVSAFAIAEQREPPAPTAQPGVIVPGQSARVSVPAARALRVRIVEPGGYRIDVISDSPTQDPIATLYRGDATVVRDDDSGENDDARIVQRLQPGIYELVVLEYKGQPLDARVTLARAPEALDPASTLRPSPGAQPAGAK